MFLFFKKSLPGGGLIGGIPGAPIGIPGGGLIPMGMGGGIATPPGPPGSLPALNAAVVASIKDWACSSIPENFVKSITIKMACQFHGCFTNL